jgi:hypothetical protein
MSAARVLIVGGYGVFGGRIVALLEDEPRLTLIVAGRSLRRAEDFVQPRRPTAKLQAAVFDRDGDLAAQLAKLAPTVVVDASGPFQAYGAARYRLVEACIAARVHYLDLADGAEFVAGIGALDGHARAAGVFCLAGASSFPVLTAAVVRRLARGLERVVAIKAGIAPSPFAGVGENVIRAIASYAGQRVPLRKNGVTGEGFPFTEHLRFTIAPPGRLPLRNTLFSLVDVPDLRVLAELWPEVDSVWMGAGPVPEVLHRALIACAWLVRSGVVRSLTPLASLMWFATNRLLWGAHRGGMFVAIEGTTAAGEAVERSWHLVAEGEDGPMIPSMAVEAIVRKLLDGQSPAPGARPAARELELTDYERLFARKAITTGVRDSSVAGSLYARLLGYAWTELPSEVRAMHDWRGTVEARGTASVERGAGLLAKLVAKLIGFPAAAAETPVNVRFSVRDGVETWTRTFGSLQFTSTQFAGRGRAVHLLCERFGPFTFAMALVVANGRLSLVPRSWSMLGVPLPLSLCPRADAHESVADGLFRFHVEICHPLTGLIVRYRGSLSSPVESAASSETVAALSKHA